MKNLRFIAPLLLFVVLVGFLWHGLSLNPREVPSPLIGKPAPGFELARLDQPATAVSEKDLRGQVWLLNVWASWCISCRDEHPFLLELAKQNVVPIVGLNYKDKRDDALAWLAQHGNPYTLSLVDPDGRVGIDYGVYGVPETYVIDKLGVIRYKYIGPLTPEIVKDKLLPLVQELGRA